MTHTIKLRTDEYLFEATGTTSQEARDQFNDAVVASQMTHIQRRDPPSANFVGQPTSGAEPLTVQFTDTSAGQVTAWSWDFGDGTSSNLQHPTHTYNADTPGNTQRFDVTLVTSGPGGTSFNRKERYIRVN